jgi:hypothetical protein
MTSDPGALEPPGPPRDWRPEWQLPRVLAVQTQRVTPEPPRRRNFESILPYPEYAIEFLVETDAPIPIRALAPVLYVGSTPVTEVREDDPTHYRFVSLEPDALEKGAPLRLGWSGQPPAEQQDIGAGYESPTS